MLTASIEGIQKRGGAQLGDKTLLDALVPIRDIVHEHAGKPDVNARDVLQRATEVANEAIERTKRSRREARPPAIHGRPQHRHARSRHRRDRHDDERSLHAVRRRAAGVEPSKN